MPMQVRTCLWDPHANASQVLLVHTWLSGLVFGTSLAETGLVQTCLSGLVCGLVQTCLSGLVCGTGLVETGLTGPL